MLKLRRGVVVAADPLEVEVAGERRPAYADAALIGPVEVGDDVVVNVEARDLGLGSGGFDLVHVNLTRGLEGGGAPADEHVMKLNYTSLQHPVEPIEPAELSRDRGLRPPVLVLPLHGHLAPAAWALAQRRDGLRAGFVQTAGGSLTAGLSRDVEELRDRGLLAGRITAGPCFGEAGAEAITVIGAIHAAAERMEWDAVLIGPGPGILGSATRLGHGGMAALDSAHAALALGFETLISPRLSSGDHRPRHRGLSHHTSTVLSLLLAPVRVPVPEVDAEAWPAPADHDQSGPEHGIVDQLREACGDRHDMLVARVDLDGYAASGLPTATMGRELARDPLFFAAPLAAGAALADAVSTGRAR